MVIPAEALREGLDLQNLCALAPLREICSVFMGFGVVEVEEGFAQVALVFGEKVSGDCGAGGEALDEIG